MIEAGVNGFGAPQVLVALAVAAVAMVVFGTAQARGKHPMVPLDLFRSRAVVIASGTGFAFIAGFYGLVFSLYLQQDRGLSSFATGLVFLPMTVLSGFVTVPTTRLAERFGPRVPIVGGMFLMGVDLTMLAVLPASALTWLLAVVMMPVGVTGHATDHRGAAGQRPRTHLGGGRRSVQHQPAAGRRTVGRRLRCPARRQRPGSCKGCARAW